ncbi:uncharacterized protein GIQ15_04105 [Arthroderma uncinatum]|uniref:uncharacterized protein n=1 Tax=Arthroderma uncinatum TaxID=74035 RepID=UPI00144ABA6B|nr:uncharacterized protein GIQ15_04105 [Arthroderma uncinatum]KAF3481346.1 hypothetical protein GIQ15_04105 [Arthroderma uncinatum]
MESPGRRSLQSGSDSPATLSPGEPETSTYTASTFSALNARLFRYGAWNNDLTDLIPVGVIWTASSNSTSRVERLSPFDPERRSLDVLRDVGWVHVSTVHEPSGGFINERVYVLPEDKLSKDPSGLDLPLRRRLKRVMSKLDTSVEAWEGKFEPGRPRGAGEVNREGETLFYIFNTLESPKPEAAHVTDPWSCTAMADLMYSGSEDGENSAVPGLRTPLYPYQRRSAALMIQKEVQPGQSLDPRFQALRGPTGRKYYYDKEEGIIRTMPNLYSNACGGILAETMGFGKTLICLAVILATRGHMPSIPSEHINTTPPVRSSTASLLEMAAATAGSHSIPWESHFRQLQSYGMHYGRCIAACNKNRGSYSITQAPRYGRRCTITKESSIRVQLSSGTLIIVPPNLVDHWLTEISKHTEGLKVLVLRDARDETPPAVELLKYDIVLFSQYRFKKESGGLSASSPMTYYSPLRELHWLRIIVDEGHNFASAREKSSSVYMLDKLQVERRWIVSGTPSKGLYGIEVSLAAENNMATCSEADIAEGILQTRKNPENVLREELKNLDKLRSMVVDFLDLKPWSNIRCADQANWTKYMKPVGPDGKRRMSLSLRSTLQSLVVRHREEDVKREVTLPKLHNEVVYLEPTFYDKASLNLFVLQIIVNAITSERTGEDYMFHPKNGKHLTLLINNLRLAGFWWTGFQNETIQETIRVAKIYLEKNMFRMSDEDLVSLRQGIVVGEKIMACDSWNAMCHRHEVGIFVENFPEYAQAFWSLDKSAEYGEPLILGISLAREAQKFVAAHLCSSDPGEGLAGAGLLARLEKYKQPGAASETSPDSKDDKNGTRVHRSKPERSNEKKTSRLKRLPSESPLKNTKVVATASAKLTYLLEKVIEFQESEKIIIFYEGENTAFWVAEGLEMLGVDFRIYASTLKQSQKSEYLSVFNEGESVRVLLMDLGQASHGLHIACASRVFIVNPIWDPNIESQAIKRAHRISQTRPVYVETLVLKDTLEDRMLKRRKQMSNDEMQRAEKDMLDDHTMSYIIQNETFLPLSDDLWSPTPAFLKTPLGFFDRHTLSIPNGYVEPDYPATITLSDPNTLATSSPMSDNKRRPTFIFESDLPTTPPGRRTPKRLRESPTQEHVDRNGIIFISPQGRTPLFSPTKGSSADIRTLLVHEDDFYKPDDRIPVTTTSSGKLVQDWDTIEAFDVKQFVSCLSYIRQTGRFPPKLQSKEDLNDATDSGVDEATIDALQKRVAQRLSQSQEQNQKTLDSSSQKSDEQAPWLTIVFVDGFLLYAPPNDSAHPLRPVHDQINLPIFLPVTYPLLKERRDGRTGYVTIGPAPTPVPRDPDEVEEEPKDEDMDNEKTEDDAPVNFWTDPPGYVDDIVWPRYISNCSWLLLPESVSETSLDEGELKRLVGNGANVREDLGISVAPQKGDATMPHLLNWAVNLIFTKIGEVVNTAR